MDWLRYSNQGAIRSKPLSDDLLKSLSFLPELGVEMEVFSGGQAPKGSGGARTGSVRHDHGNAADVFFYKGGRRLDWANPEDQPIFSDIVRRAKQNGVTGFGAGKGYMQPGSMHIGFGTPSVWGTGGKGANAPSWLTAAYNGTPHTPNDGHNHNPATPQAIANDTMIALGKKPISEVPTVFGGQSSDKLGAEPMQQKPRGLLGMMFPDMDDEKRERIKYGLAGLGALSPVGANTRVMDRIDDRRDKREARAESAQQRNATAAWLAKQPGGAQYAEAIASGALPASAALQMYQQASAGQAPTKGVVVNGQLVNPITGEQIGDYRDPQGDMTTAVQTLQQRAEAGGLVPGTPEYQQFMIQGGAANGISLSVGPDGSVQFNQGGAAKPLTEAQSKDTVYATRAQGALPTLDKYDMALAGIGDVLLDNDPTGIVRQRAQSDEYQLARQAGEEFLQAILRKDTGAAITKDEQVLYGQTYLPQPGDGPEVIEQKRQSRQRALAALKSGMTPQAIIQQEKALKDGGFDPQTPDFSKMSDDELNEYIQRGGR